jgi:ubiquinone/menaquinone biosynthesis C-methylase UbiE
MMGNRRQILKDTFDAVADGYDGKALRFFSASAAHMATMLGLRGDEDVLDVACGTGHASIAIARLLPRGRGPVPKRDHAALIPHKPPLYLLGNATIAVHAPR